MSSMSSKSLSLTNKVVVVTGAARGIGRATAARLVAAGARVAIGDLSADLAATTAAEIEQATPGATLVGLAVDVTDVDKYRSFLEEVVATLGPIDVLVNNAGIMPVGPMVAETTETARAVFDVNVHGVLNGMKLVAPEMIKRGRGQIVNIASYAGLLAVPGQVSYAGSKAAVIAMTQAAQWELEGAGVRVGAVVPSFTNTELIAGTGSVRSQTPNTPEDVADAVIKVITARRNLIAVYVPGSVRPVGGAMAKLPRRARYALHRWLGTDTSFLKVDTDTRRAYDERVSDVARETSKENTHA